MRSYRGVNAVCFSSYLRLFFQHRIDLSDVCIFKILNGFCSRKIFSFVSSRSFYAKPYLVSARNMNIFNNTTRLMEFHDVISSNKLMTKHIRAGDLNSAVKLFAHMPIKSVVTWNILLSGYCRFSKSSRDARDLFDKIPQPNTVSYNTMLSCYFHNSDVGAAWDFFNRIPRKDIASWNTMISGFSQNGMMTEAQEFFSLMPGKNEISWNSMISGYVESGNLDMAVNLFSMAPCKTVITWTAIITGFMRFGKIEEAERLFEEMPMRTEITWNSMIAGYVENSGSEHGLKFFNVMRESGVGPNPLTLTSVLLGCSKLSALSLGRQVHQLTLKLPIYSDTTVGTSLVSMYVKCGVHEDAWKLFVSMRKKDVVTWNAMISGYAQHGEADKSLSLFAEMISQGTKPDWITFVAVLMACNHSGLVDMGVQFFDAMPKKFGIDVLPCHYACMVDLLGRSGRLNEALDLIKEMPFRPHSAIFGTLLGACRIHKNLEVAEYAAKQLIDLEPSSAMGYVQLANVYAAMKRWDLVVRTRRIMNENRVVKEPGYSWIEVKGVVYGFRSRDRIHPELEAIHEKLQELEKQIKLAGYVPDLESALHDVGKEQKEQLLMRHSEKLAVAYGLMKIPRGNPILVFKNLRVCGDCHLAIKYISAVEGREIILRDTTRFHHFKNGVCSCGDYW